mmetsp:Transcript_13006/g.25996  ORF Transcript_13006/g.25996 Transcript_13006/m.25996 type:complete len:86 (+) Transcript_13006:1500-1757(+)
MIPIASANTDITRDKINVVSASVSPVPTPEIPAAIHIAKNNMIHIFMNVAGWPIDSCCGRRKALTNERKSIVVPAIMGHTQAVKE